MCCFVFDFNCARAVPFQAPHASNLKNRFHPCRDAVHADWHRKRAEAHVSLAPLFSGTGAFIHVGSKLLG